MREDLPAAEAGELGSRVPADGQDAEKLPLCRLKLSGQCDGRLSDAGCAIQLRYQAINETKVMMELKFSKDKFNATFNKFIMPNKERRGRYKTTFKSVRPKKFTKLDHIESDLSDDMV